ncbi:hypothetical protein T484DRAFT_3646669 [Baffinella frigidus]|nr:hypothetical protein T484DRAFT_3646669 [Cryptophyta sp. CCMP2293]
MPGSPIAHESSGRPHHDRSHSSQDGSSPQQSFRDPAVDMEANDDVDWAQVLQSLQREKKRAVARIEEQYVNRSLFCLESSSTLRESVIKFVEWPVFNGVILLLIGLNCIFLTLEHPLCKCTNDPVCTEQEYYIRMLSMGLDCTLWPTVLQILNVTELMFTALFTMEMVSLPASPLALDVDPRAMQPAAEPCPPTPNSLNPGQAKCI